MIHKELDRSTMFPLVTLYLFHFRFIDISTSLPIKLDQEQSLILDSREQIVFADKVEYMRTSQPEEVW